MVRLQGLCLVLIATLYGGCHAQKIIRTLMPMTLMESCPTGGCTYEDSSTCADDLNALLLLARALEADRATYANKGIDINGLLDNLIHALVYIATHHGGKGPSFPPGNTGTIKDPLIDLHLLGSGKDNVAALGVAGAQIVGLGIGGGNDGKGTGTSNNSGGLNGATGAVSGITGTTSGMTGTVSGVSGAVSSITGSASGNTESVSAVSGAVSAITGKASGTTGTVSGVTGAVSGVTGTTSGMTGTVSGVTGAVSGVTGTTSGMTGAVSGVSGAVSGVTAGSGGGLK